MAVFEKITTFLKSEGCINLTQFLSSEVQEEQISNDIVYISRVASNYSILAKKVPCGSATATVYPVLVGRGEMCSAMIR